MLPRVKIIFENGALGITTPSNDGVVGVVASGVAVAGKFALGTCYLLTSIDSLTALGISAASWDANACIFKFVSEFYSEAPNGTKLWLMGVAATVLMATMLDKTQAYAKAMIEQANGAINFIAVTKAVTKADANGSTPTTTNGLDEDVYDALAKAQELGVWAADVKFAPIFSIIEGRHYSGNPDDLANLGILNYNRACVLIGDTYTGSVGASVGVLAGRYAASPVQRSAARVKSGALSIPSFYIGSVAAELGSPDLISDAGFITMRTFSGLAGYYFSDDKLACDPTDDYALVPRRRVIDKAYRIAYNVLVKELNDEIPTTANGQIPAPIVKNIQNSVAVAIENQMTAYGNLGTDPANAKDTGVVCYIDPAQNVVSTSMLSISLKVKPFGYAKYIDLYLGFKTAVV